MVQGSITGKKGKRVGNMKENGPTINVTAKGHLLGTMEKYTKDAFMAEKNMELGFRFGQMGRYCKENGMMGR